MPRLRVLVCNNPADESVAEAFGQLKAKHPDVVFEHVIIGRDREEAKAIFRQLDHSESQQRAVLSSLLPLCIASTMPELLTLSVSFGWMHGLRPM